MNHQFILDVTETLSLGTFSTRPVSNAHTIHRYCAHSKTIIYYYYNDNIIMILQLLIASCVMAIHDNTVAAEVSGTCGHTFGAFFT